MTRPGEVTVKTRLQTITQALLKCHLKERLIQVERHLKQIDQAIMELIAQDDELLARLNILTSIPGISDITAFSMLIEMPELGQCPESRPHASQVWHRSQGSLVDGKVRNASEAADHSCAEQCMPALCTIRHDLAHKAKYQQLITAEKPAGRSDSHHTQARHYRQCSAARREKMVRK